MSHQLRMLDQYFQMEEGSIGDPDFYLGTRLKLAEMENGVKAWGMSPSKYVQEAVRNIEDHLKKKGMPGLNKRVLAPFPTGSLPELDTSREPDPDEVTVYQSEIGILRWLTRVSSSNAIGKHSMGTYRKPSLLMPLSQGGRMSTSGYMLTLTTLGTSVTGGPAPDTSSS